MLMFTHDKTTDLSLSQLLKLFTSPQCCIKYRDRAVKATSVDGGHQTCHYGKLNDEHQEFHTAVIMSCNMWTTF